MQRWLIWLVIFSLTLGSAAAAQDNDTLDQLRAADPPTLDRAALGLRYGLVSSLAAIDPAPDYPAYLIEDTRQFWVTDERQPYRELPGALMGSSDGVYMWVEQGIQPRRELLDEAAQHMHEELFPAVEALLGLSAGEGVDGDTHIHILHTQRLGATFGYFDVISQWPNAVAPYSNELDLLVLHLSLGPDFVGTDLYYALAAREYARMLLYQHDPDEDHWANMALASLAAWQAGYPLVDGLNALGLSSIEAFLLAPDTQLNAWPRAPQVAHQGAALLFGLYLYDRFGAEAAGAWANAPENGMAGLEAALEAVGAGVDANGLFADWLLTNAINSADFGPEYLYSSLGEPGEQLFAGVDEVFEFYPVSVFGAQVNPFGAHYASLVGGPITPLQLDFDGSAIARVLPLTAYSGEYVYWSNRGSGIDTTLTRAFDLRGVDAEDEPALHFQAWYDIIPDWDYGYVAISSDGGERWEAAEVVSSQTRETDQVTFENAKRLALGPGLTGVSGGGGMAPYPWLGVTFLGQDAVDMDLVDLKPMMVTALAEDGPAAAAGLLVGDEVLSIQGVLVERPAEVGAVIDGLMPGDTVKVSVLREGVLEHIAITLGETYQRGERPAPPQWVLHTVDLADYAGESILVRFEYVTAPGITGPGMAIDDIALDAVDFFDDAETDEAGWEAAGWVRMDNMIPQHFTVRVVESGGTIQSVVDAGATPQGEAQFTVGGGKAALLVISGTTRFTMLPGAYGYTLRLADE